jgi:hypothetical protein
MSVGVGVGVGLDVEVDVARFWEKGYQILRGVYTPEEVQRFRDGAYKSLGTGGELLSRPQLRDAILDGRMVRVARQILGSDDIMYAGDSSFTINSKQHGYHKDNADRKDSNAPDWQGRYTILRFGIYLQDHTKHTGGLNLRVASHNTPDLSVGKTIYVKTRPGDLAVWSLRTTHSGNGKLLKFPPWITPEPNTKRWPWFYREAKPDGDRIAIFAALGLDDHHMKRYTEYLKTRKYMVDIWRHSRLDPEVFDRAAQIGLKIRDMYNEIKDDPTVGQHTDWQPLPY